MADGRCGYINANVSPQVLKAAITRAGSEQLPPGWERALTLTVHFPRQPNRGDLFGRRAARLAGSSGSVPATRWWPIGLA